MKVFVLIVTRLFGSLFTDDDKGLEAGANFVSAITGPFAPSSLPVTPAVSKNSFNLSPSLPNLQGLTLEP